MFGGDGADSSFDGPPRPRRGVCRQLTHRRTARRWDFRASHRAISAPSILHAHRTAGDGGDDIMFGGDGHEHYFKGPPQPRVSVLFVVSTPTGAPHGVGIFVASH